jgi:hypothetical protein
MNRCLAALPVDICVELVSMDLVGQTDGVEGHGLG